MPIFLEPDQKYPVVLDSDKDKEPKPTFLAKSQSMRGQQRVADCLDKWNDDGITAGDLFDATVQTLGEVLVGWKNMGQEYSVDALRDVLTYGEARELLRKVMHNQHLDLESKKNSESQPL